MPSSDTPETSPALREAMSELGMTSLPPASKVLPFPDGGTVFVKEFLEYEDVPFLTSTDGKFWRMRSSNETTFEMAAPSTSPTLFGPSSG